MQEAGERCGSLPYSWPNHDDISREAYYFRFDCYCCNYTGKGARTIYSPFNSRTRGGDPHRKKVFFAPPSSFSLLWSRVCHAVFFLLLLFPPKAHILRGNGGLFFSCLLGGTQEKKLLVPPASYFLFFSREKSSIFISRRKKTLGSSQGKNRF